jgi:hypothetical protein
MTIQDLRYANQRAVMIKERYRQDGARAISGLQVDGAIEAGIFIRVGNIDDLLRSGGSAGNACRHGDADDVWSTAHIANAVRHLREEFHRLGVKLKHSRALSLQ